MNNDLGIVGLGTMGSQLALNAADSGFKVSVYEKHTEPGGRNRGIKAGGFVFDSGPTFLLMKGVLDEMFELCDRRSDDYLQFMRLSFLKLLAYRLRGWL